MSKPLPLPELFTRRYCRVPIAFQLLTVYGEGDRQTWRVLRVFGLRLALWLIG